MSAGQNSAAPESVLFFEVKRREVFKGAADLQDQLRILMGADGQAGAEFAIPELAAFFRRLSQRESKAARATSSALGFLFEADHLPPPGLMVVGREMQFQLVNPSQRLHRLEAALEFLLGVDIAVGKKENHPIRLFLQHFHAACRARRTTGMQ